MFNSGTYEMQEEKNRLQTIEANYNRVPIHIKFGFLQFSKEKKKLNKKTTHKTKQLEKISFQPILSLFDLKPL